MGCGECCIIAVILIGGVFLFNRNIFKDRKTNLKKHRQFIAKPSNITDLGYVEVDNVSAQIHEKNYLKAS